MQKGFIGYLLLLIVALALLKYFFDWSIFDALASEKGQATLDYIVDVLKYIWSLVMIPVNFVIGLFK